MEKSSRLSLPRQRGASAVETGFMIALIGVVCIGGLASVGSSAGGEDIENAAAGLGYQEVDADTEETRSAGNGAGGSSGSFGNAATGVSGTGLSGGFEGNSAGGGGYWNTHQAGAKVGEDWEVVSGSVDARTTHSNAFNMSIEGDFLDLNGGNAGHIRRSVDVIPNATYNLSVDIAENTFGGPAEKEMEVIWNGVVISTLTIDLPRDETRTFTVRLPAIDASQGVLEFRSLKGSAYGPIIDNPTFTLIPDPD